MWLLRLLHRVTDAVLQAEEPVRDTRCDRLAARSDLAMASAAGDGGLTPPEVDRF
jgi:hypothetical protein